MRTLADHQSRALTTPVNQGETNTAVSVKALHNLIQTQFTEKAFPDHEAIRFYMLNHAMALVRQKVGMDADLGKFLPIVERYYSVCTPMAARALVYMLWTTVREMRHHKSHISPNYGEVSKKFGPEATDFLLKTGGGEDAAQAQLVKKPPHTPLANFVSCISHLFKDYNWGGSYGGPAWATVSDCLLAYVTGQTSAEAMLDTVWTLAHNNGPIFNKPLLYDNYSAQFMSILDIQAAGQIPQWVGAVYEDASPEILDDWKLCAELLPEFTHPVDESMVMKAKGFTKAKQKADKSKDKVKSPTMTHTTSGTVTGSHHGPSNFQVDPTVKVPLKTAEEVLAGLDKKTQQQALKTVEALGNLAKKAEQTGGASKNLGHTIKITKGGKIKFQKKVGK